MTRRARRRPNMLRIGLLTALIAGALYVNQFVVPATPPLFLPTPTPTISAESFINRAQEMFSGGKLDQAIEAYTQAISADPNNPASYVELARLQVFAGDYTEAVQNAKNALLKNDKYPQAHAVLGWAQMYLDNYSDAELEIKKALSLDPNNALAHAYYAELLANEGESDFALYEKAGLEAKTAVGLDNNLMEAHRARGIAFLAVGNTEQAIEAFQTALSMNKNIPDLHYYLGVSYRIAQQYDKAQESLLYAYSLNPQDTSALRELAAAFYADGRFAQASQYAEEAVKVEPANTRLHGYLGITYYKQQLYDKAIPELAYVIKGGQTADGVAIEKIPLSYDERVMEYYWYYAFALARSARCEEAVPVFQQILITVPDNEIAMYNANEGIAMCTGERPTPAPPEEATESP